jgi:hypothetical protein
MNDFNIFLAKLDLYAPYETRDQGLMARNKHYIIPTMIVARLYIDKDHKFSF